MIDIQCSGAKKHSSHFVEIDRRSTQDNVDWIQKHFEEGSDAAHLILIGGIDPISLRLRMAQAKARQDYTPSHWSHVCFMQKPAKRFGQTSVLEIRVDPPSGFDYPPATNAVQKGKLDDYRDSKRFPNVALMRLPIRRTKVDDVCKQFRMQRNVISGVDNLTAWLAYVWGVTNATNPLLDEVGVPSAVFLEYVVGAVGFDLTPGLASRASCPEAIWQTAKWWHEFYEADMDESNDDSTHPIVGQWTTPNNLHYEG